MSLRRLSLSSKPSALNLAQRLGAAHDGDRADGDNDGQGLEQVPGSVVEKEDKLNAHDRTKEGGVRDGSGADGLGQMVGVGT